MIKIIKEGKQLKAPKIAICSNCECEFNYEYEDIISSLNLSNIAYVKCPHCGRFIIVPSYFPHKDYQPYITPNPLPYWVNQFNNIPDACKGCSNHPSNGGSGLCNCTLGLPKITWSCSASANVLN